MTKPFSTGNFHRCQEVSFCRSSETAFVLDSIGAFRPIQWENYRHFSMTEKLTGDFPNYEIRQRRRS